MKSRLYLLLILLPLFLVSFAGSCRKSSNPPPRFTQPLVFKINGGSAAVRQYSGVIQQQLAAVGIPVQIDAVERNTLLDQMRAGQFQLGTGNWIGGNQDPIFLKDLFGTGAPFNRGKYGNPELDKLLNEAVLTADRTKAIGLYTQAQQMITDEVPMLPLWYSENMIVTRKDVDNVKPDPSGDFRYLAQVTAGPRTEPFTVAFEAEPDTLDGLFGTDGQSERLRQLIHTSLIKKNEKFEYVGDLSENPQTSADNLTTTFNIRAGVTFQDGKPVTAADAKYTLDTLLNAEAKARSRKANPFFEKVDGKDVSYVESVTANGQTLTIKLKKPWLQLLSNLVSVPIIPAGSAAQQKEKPLGSGAYKFVSYDKTNKIIELEAYDKYWGGAPNIKKLRAKVILDAGTLQAELKAGRVDLASNAISLSPDVLEALKQDPNLKVVQAPGANIVYLLFNSQSAPLNDKRARQAIAYAIDRETIVKNLLLNQARVAHSILPESSWAYTPGTKYGYDPEKAKKILDEAGFTAK
jgi:ABC-type transport system substrate-binding protein